jgi:hypothetical protein
MQFNSLLRFESLLTTGDKEEQVVHNNNFLAQRQQPQHNTKAP